MSNIDSVTIFHGSPGGEIDFLPLQKSIPNLKIHSPTQTARAGSREPSFVFAYSWGGLKALDFAANHPNEVKGVVWFAPYFIEKPKSPIVYWLMKNQITRNFLLEKKASKIVNEFVLKSAAPKKAPVEYQQWAQAHLSNPQALSTAVIEKNDLYSQTNEIVAQFNASQIPLYVIVGSEDQSFDRNQNKFYRSLKKLSETVISGAGHLLIWTDTEQVTEELKKIIG